MNVLGVAAEGAADEEGPAVAGMATPTAAVKARIDAESETDPMVKSPESGESRPAAGAGAPIATERAAPSSGVCTPN